MALIYGTAVADILVGTSSDDILTPYGTHSLSDPDQISGGDGADTYDLRAPVGETSVHSYVIDDNGTDGAVDQITYVGALHYSASLGYQGWASVVRIGDDLIIDTPSRPHRFRKPSKPSFHIEVKDHFNGEAVEFLNAGGVTYALAASAIGSLDADIIGGTHSRDVLRGLDGDDWLFGNGGNDRVDTGEGDDIAFGGDGNDKLLGRSGDDRLDGGEGNDRINGGSGNDWILGQAGNDLIRAGSGDDWIDAGSGDDRIFGKSGADTLTGGLGNDWMSGGRDGDTYRLFADSDGPGWGNDVIEDRGSRASYGNVDVIELFNFYGPSSGGAYEAIARLSFARVGNDMVLTADGGTSTLTVTNMFDTRINKYFIEQLHLNGAYWTPINFNFIDGSVSDIGDDRDYPYGYAGKSNEVMFGTDGNDNIYGNTGHNFIWTGDGNDVLVYKENDPVPFASFSATVSHDIVEDFDIAHDLLDFSEMRISLADLVLSEDADGDAVINWNTAVPWEITPIVIELRGVALADVTEDIFIF